MQKPILKSMHLATATRLHLPRMQHFLLTACPIDTLLYQRLPYMPMFGDSMYRISAHRDVNL